MVKHIVLWKIKDSAEKQQNIDRMIEMLTALVGKIDGLVSVEMGHNFNTSSEYDVVLYATLKNTSALRYYQNHPEHVKCKEFISAIAENRTAADYFFEDDIVSAKPVDEVADAPETPEPPASETTAESSAQPVPESIGPEITVTWPEKRVFEESLYYITRPMPAEEKSEPEFEEPAAAKEPIPYKPPVITVKRPPLWEPEVFEPPVDFAPEISEPAAKAQPAPVEFAPEISEPAAEAQPAPVEFAPEISEPAAETQPAPVEFAPEISEPAAETQPAPVEFAPEPMRFEDIPAAPMKFEDIPAAPMKFEDSPVASKPAPVKEKIKESKSFFGKKKLEVEVTPLENDPDTWTCPNCGKVMPNYVGTCGCGEPKPFEFEPPIPSDSSSQKMPDIAPSAEPKNKLSPEQMAEFNNVAPSIQGYNPLLKNDTVPTSQAEKFGYIQNDRITNSDPNYQAPDLSFINNQDNAFNNEATNNISDDHDYNAPLDPFDFSNAPPAAPMRFSDISDNSASFNSAPSPSPMRFDDTPPAPMRFDDLPPAAPMRFNDAPQSAPSAPAEKQTASSSAKNNKEDKKRLFGKKAKEADALRKAEEVVNNRKDVPNDGTWTCPNCGKVMPKYVGTCGCGEPQPFEF